MLSSSCLVYLSILESSFDFYFSLRLLLLTSNFYAPPLLSSKSRKSSTTSVFFPFGFRGFSFTLPLWTGYAPLMLHLEANSSGNSDSAASFLNMAENYPAITSASLTWFSVNLSLDSSQTMAFNAADLKRVTNSLDSMIPVSWISFYVGTLTFSRT